EHAAGAGRLAAAGRDRGRAVLLCPLLRRAHAPAGTRPVHEPAAGYPGHPRGAVRRGGRERPAVRHPVPPREVRRRGRGAAGQLAGDAPVSLTLLPAVDVAGGQAVRLVQGAAASETSYGDPLQAALAWQEAGAQWIHLGDLDAAFGRGSNAAL